MRISLTKQEGLIDDAAGRVSFLRDGQTFFLGQALARLNHVDLLALREG